MSPRCTAEILTRTDVAAHGQNFSNPFCTVSRSPSRLEGLASAGLRAKETFGAKVVPNRLFLRALSLTGRGPRLTQFCWMRVS